MKSHLALAVASRLVRQAGMIAVVIFAARALDKDAFGAWAFSNVLVQFGITLSESGVGVYVVREKLLDESKFQASVSICALVSSLVSLALGLVVSPLAQFMGMEDYSAPIAFTCLGIFPAALSVVLQARLRRDRDFSSTFFTESWAALSLLSSSGLLLFMGYGLWAFVIGQLLSALAGCFSSILILRRTTRIAVPSWDDIRHILSFSLPLGLHSVMNFSCRNIDDILVAKFLGPASLGQYSLAYRFMTLPVTQVNAITIAIALPYFSPHQDRKERLRDLLNFLLAINGMAVCGPMLFAWLSREHLIAVCFGEQWTLVDDILAVFIPLGILQVFVSPLGICYHVRGETKLLFKWGIAQTSVTLVAFSIGVMSGSLIILSWTYAVAYICVSLFIGGVALSLIDAGLMYWLRSCWIFLVPIPICGLIQAYFIPADLEPSESFSIAACIAAPITVSHILFVYLKYRANRGTLHDLSNAR